MDESQEDTDALDKPVSFDPKKLVSFEALVKARIRRLEEKERIEDSLFEHPGPEEVRAWITAKQLLSFGTPTAPRIVETSTFGPGFAVALGRFEDECGSTGYRVLVIQDHKFVLKKVIPTSVVLLAYANEMSPLCAALASDALLRLDVAKIVSPDVGLAEVEAGELMAIANGVETGEKPDTKRL